jgi:hypothetical protein
MCSAVDSAKHVTVAAAEETSRATKLLTTSSQKAVATVSTAVADFAGECAENTMLGGSQQLDANGIPQALAFDMVTTATGFDMPRYACPLLTPADLVLELKTEEERPNESPSSKAKASMQRQFTTRLLCAAPPSGSDTASKGFCPGAIERIDSAAANFLPRSVRKSKSQKDASTTATATSQQDAAASATAASTPTKHAETVACSIHRTEFSLGRQASLILHQHGLRGTSREDSLRRRMAEP